MPLARLCRLAASPKLAKSAVAHGMEQQRWRFVRGLAARKDVLLVDEVALGSYFSCMRSVGIKVLNSKLSEYVRLAASGETVLVTDRDLVVAELGPLRETRSSVLADAFLAEAVRSGVLAPPTLAGSGPPPRPAPVACLDEIMAELDESRRDR